MANKRNKLKEDFKSYLEECNSVSYNNSYTNYSDRCDLTFYEWSDLHLLPLEFYSINDFITFLDESNIIYSEGLIDVLRCGGEYHGCCYVGNNILLLSDDINDLYNKMLD